MKQGLKAKDIKQDHPGHRLQGQWDYLSLVDNDPHSPILIDGCKLVLPRQCGKEQAINIHAGTHGSIKQMMSTLSSFLNWESMQEDVEKAWYACDPCLADQRSQQDGRPRLDKQKLTDLEPMSVLHFGSLSVCREILPVY